MPKGLLKTFKKVCSKMGFQVHFKGGSSINNLLVAPKDRGTITEKSGVIYKCYEEDGNEEYIGESARTFGERLEEQLRAPTPIYDHDNTPGHYSPSCE